MRIKRNKIIFNQRSITSAEKTSAEIMSWVKISFSTLSLIERGYRVAYTIYSYVCFIYWLEVTNEAQLRTKLYETKDDFNFPIKKNPNPEATLPQRRYM